MLSPIKTNLADKLKDKGYRQRFFRGRAEDEIAYSLRKFRKVRNLNQKQLADLSGMKQSAVSRLEQASYSKWNWGTLWRIADALDVRVKVSFDSSEEAIKQYERVENRVNTIEFIEGSFVNAEYAMNAKQIASNPVFSNPIINGRQSWKA